MKFMVSCIKCNSTLGDNVITCPICGTNQSSAEAVDLDNVSKQLTSSATIMIQGDSEDEYVDTKLEVERLIKRGDDCFNSGKKWRGTKDRSRARREFQRAFKYYETVLKLDPTNEKARNARSKCLMKMA